MFRLFFCACQEALKKELETMVDKLFTRWESSVVQTPSNGGKTFSYMVTHSVSRQDLQTRGDPVGKQARPSDTSLPSR